MTGITQTDVIPHSGIWERILSLAPRRLAAQLRDMFSGSSVTSKAMRGSVWTIAGFGGGQILRLGSNLILTRLLAPEAFGLMALINVFLLCLEMLSDIGVHAAIIHNKRGDDPEFLCTAWTIGVIRGVLLWAVACLIAWPVAVFYNEPRLMLMIPVSGLIVLITGFQTTAMAQHNRHMKLERLTMLQLAAQAINLLVMILLAWQMRSVWALVIGGVVGATVQVTLAHFLLPGIRHRFVLNRDDVREIVRFGKWLFFATAIGYLAGQASDKLALGKLVDRDTLGVYSMAFMLAQLPSSVVTVLIGRVLYPALAEASRQDCSRFGEKLQRARTAIWPPLMLLILGLGFFGPLTFKLLWDSRYHAAGWMLQLMLAVVWLDGLNCSLNAALLARGDSFASAVQNAISLIIGIPGMIIGYTMFELPGLILGITAGRLCAHLALHLMLCHRGISVWRQDLSLHLIMLFYSGLIYLTSVGEISIPGVGHFATGSVARGDKLAMVVAMVSMMFAIGFWWISRPRATVVATASSPAC
jgi:O-antigen/teichoic acid export membrane protein